MYPIIVIDTKKSMFTNKLLNYSLFITEDYLFIIYYLLSICEDIDKIKFGP